MHNEYQIIHSAPMAFELQVKRWWWPIWLTINFFHKIEDAEKYARGHNGGVVKYLGKIEAETGEE